MRSCCTMARPSSGFFRPLFDLAFKPDFSFERKAMKRGLCATGRARREAGRGALRRAGRRRPPSSSNPKRIPEGLYDLKRLTAQTREDLFAHDSRLGCRRLGRLRSAPPASTASTSCALSGGHARCASAGARPHTAAARAGRRPRRAAGADLRRRGAGEGRPALAIDRRRPSRRQGDAGPDDARIAGRARSTAASKARWATPPSSPPHRHRQACRRPALASIVPPSRRSWVDAGRRRSKC